MLRNVKHRRGGSPPAVRAFSEDLFVIEYTPQIGDISEAVTQENWKDHFYELFHRLTTDEYRHCKSHFIVLASSEFVERDEKDRERQWRSPLGAFYERSFSRQLAYAGDKDKLEMQVSEREKKVDHKLCDLDKGPVAVWRSIAIGAVHYFVTKDACIMYSVVPEVHIKEEANEINGAMTSDIDQIIASREVVKSYLREAVTPRTKIKDGLVHIVFPVGQSRINKIEVEYYDASKNKLDVGQEIQKNALGKNLVAMASFELKTPPKARWLRVRLFKDSDRTQDIWSEFSYYVPIPQVSAPAMEGESTAVRA